MEPMTPVRTMCPAKSSRPVLGEDCVIELIQRCEFLLIDEVKFMHKEEEVPVRGVQVR
jgi:hypothetical protein